MLLLTRISTFPRICIDSQDLPITWHQYPGTLLLRKSLLSFTNMTTLSSHSLFLVSGSSLSSPFRFPLLSSPLLCLPLSQPPSLFQTILRKSSSFWIFLPLPLLVYVVLGIKLCRDLMHILCHHLVPALFHFSFFFPPLC